METSGLDLGTLLTDIAAAVGHILDIVALLQLLVEGLILATTNAPGTSLDADEVHLAIVRRRMEGVVLLLLAQQCGFGSQCRATETQEGLGIAILDLIGPIALVGGRIPGQTHGAIEDESLAGGAVHELSTMAGIAHAIVAKLVGAILRGLGGLQTTLGLRALHIDGIATGIARRLLVVQQTVGAQLLLGHSVLALDVGVAGSRHRSGSIRLPASSGGCGS